MSSKYSDGELIEYYRQFSIELGRPASQTDVNKKRKIDKSFPSVPVLQRRIGFDKLAKLCGFKSNKHKIYTKQELLDILYDYYHKHGIPKQDDFDNNPDLPSSVTYGKYFGGIRKALIKLGLIEEDVNYSVYQNMTDEDILNLIKEFYNKNGNIKGTDFVKRNNLPTQGFLRKRFGSLENIYERCGIQVKDRYFSKYKNASDDILLEKLKWYCENIGFPTNRSLMNNRDMPSYTLYVERFGSVKNALNQLGIDIPEEREWLFNRVSMSDDEILDSLKKHTELKIKNGGLSLLTLKEIAETDELPSQSVIILRFGSIENVYNRIGYDYKSFNQELRQKDMIEKYLEIRDTLGKTPTSREIEYFSRNYDNYYSMSSYEFHFGSLTGLQKRCGLIPTGITRHKTKDDLIKDLQKLHNELQRTPLMMDLFEFDYMSSPTKYLKEFGGFTESLIAAGIKPNVNSYYTPKGTKCLSYYELRITEWLEKNSISFEKEVHYKDVIESDNTNRRFDWVLYNNNNTYYVEMFGIIGFEEYEEKRKKKIEDCKRNNVNLIAIYPDDLKRPLNEVFSFLCA